MKKVLIISILFLIGFSLLQAQPTKEITILAGKQKLKGRS